MYPIRNYSMSYTSVLTQRGEGEGEVEGFEYGGEEGVGGVGRVGGGGVWKERGR